MSQDFSLATRSRAHSLVGVSQGRPDEDFYPTPPYATESLLDKEEIRGTVWEPTCGDGSMSTVLMRRGHDVFSTDLYDRGFGCLRNADFLNYDWGKAVFDNVITNPPYSLAQQFAENALNYSRDKVCLLLKLQFLEGARRRKFLLESPLKTVHVFSKRLSFARDGVAMKNSGMICFAWFVWQHGYEGSPSIEWI